MKLARYLAIFAAGLVTISTLTLAQEAPSFDFSSMGVDVGGEAKLENNRWVWGSGGINIVLRPSDPEVGDMVLKSDEVEFTYGEEGGMMPETITMKGNVSVDGPSGKIRAGEASLAVEDMSFTFTGDVHGSTPEIESFSGGRLVYSENQIELTGGASIQDPVRGNIKAGSIAIDYASNIMTMAGGVSGSMPDLENFTADRIIYNLATGDAKVTGMKVPMLQMQNGGGGSSASSSSIKTSHVSDWPGFIARIQQAGADASPSPGKRIMELMNESQRSQFASITSQQAADPAIQKDVLKGLNALLGSKTFYDSTYWQGVALNDEVKTLIAKDAASLTNNEVRRRNRLLLEAAFPGIAKSPLPAPAAPAEPEPAKQ